MRCVGPGPGAMAPGPSGPCTRLALQKGVATVLRNAMQCRGFQVEATDGRIGSVSDLYFDDAEWIIRYVVVDTGNWLAGRRVLITPASLRQPAGDDHVFPVCLTRKQVEESPAVDTDKPVYLQRLNEIANQFVWTGYSDPSCFGPSMILLAMPRPGSHWHPDEPATDMTRREGDPHLRSMVEVCTYRIQAADGEIGHVEDFIVDDRDWTIRYIVIDTGNWLPGRKVPVPPRWLDHISWDEKKAHVSLERDIIRNAPKYDSSTPIRRLYEIQLYDYYGKPGYWVCETFLGV